MDKRKKNYTKEKMGKIKKGARPKFFTFSQNNSGGYFIEDSEKGIGPDIVIEAFDERHAKQIFEEIGNTFYGFYDSCSCCGDRWGECDDSDGSDEIKVWKSSLRKSYYVHYLNKKIKKFKR